MPAKDLCRRHNFSGSRYYLWRSKYAGMEVTNAKRLKALETENTRVKKRLAEALLEQEVTRAVLRKKSGKRTRTSPRRARDAESRIYGTPCPASRWHDLYQAPTARCPRQVTLNSRSNKIDNRPHAINNTSDTANRDQPLTPRPSPNHACT